MKLIIGIVRPFTIDRLVVAFENIEGFPGMTIMDSEGFGQKFVTNPNDTINPFKPDKRIEIACNDDMVEQIVAAIRTGAHTGKKGDGIILVTPVENAYLI